MYFKKLMSKYGAIFSLSFFGAFFGLVTLRFRYGGEKIESGILGDMVFHLGEKTVFLPFTSSLALAAIITIMYEAYNIFKRF
jgi:hypothetical protein